MGDDARELPVWELNAEMGGMAGTPGICRRLIVTDTTLVASSPSHLFFMYPWAHASGGGGSRKGERDIIS